MFRRDGRWIVQPLVEECAGRLTRRDRRGWIKVNQGGNRFVDVSVAGRITLTGKVCAWVALTARRGGHS